MKKWKFRKKSDFEKREKIEFLKKRKNEKIEFRKKSKNRKFRRHTWIPNSILIFSFLSRLPIVASFT